MNLFVFFIASLFWSNSPDVVYNHDFHLSRCDIIYNTQEKAIQISLQLFIDDLEMALSAKGYENLGICTEKEIPEAEEYIYAYLLEHLQLSIDESPITLDWVGKEVSDDLAGIWCYLEVYPDTPRKSIDVRNDLLVEVFADQRNIVKLIYSADQKAHFLFDKKEMEGTLNIAK